jgi:uncharacterized protein (TIGR00106 family)
MMERFLTADPSSECCFFIWTTELIALVNEMIVAELTVVPLGEGTSISRFVKRAIDVLRERGVRSVPGAMGTVLEVHSLDELFAAAKAAHEAVFKVGAMRVVTTLRFDERRDKEMTMRSKLEVIS